MVLEELIAEQILARGLVDVARLNALRARRAAGDPRTLEVLLLEEGLVDHETLQSLLAELWGASLRAGQAGPDPTRSSEDSWDFSVLPSGDPDSGTWQPGERLELRPGLGLVVRGELGRGGMGVVYLVMDPGLRRLAALKVIRDFDPGKIWRFQREAVITARLDHPGIPAVFEAGALGKKAYLLMQYLPGKSLSDKVATLREQYAKPPIHALRPFLDDLVRVCEAMGYAHSHGVVHRDLKPDNIMLGSFGEVCVVDWGLARDRTESASEDRALRRAGAARPASQPGHTEDGALLGTVGFMAPEQARGELVDERADVFALGAVLSVILTGFPPVDARASALQALASVGSGSLIFPRERRPDLPAEVLAIAAKALDPDRERRYESADALGRDLRAYLEGRPVSVLRYGAWSQTRAVLRQHPALFASLGAAFLMAVVGVGVAFEVRARGVESAREQALIEAREAGEAARGRREEPDLDSGQRLARALLALSASERWAALAPEDEDAAALQYDAAVALGDVARDARQWALAEEAYALAVGLNVDSRTALRLREEAARAATATERDRRDHVVQVLERAESGLLGRTPDGLQDGMISLLRYPDAQTVELLAARLDGIVRSLEGLVQRKGEPLDQLARRQRELLGQARLEVARLCSGALGWIGHRERAVASLAAYLRVEADQHRAVEPALALVRLGGDQALGAVRDKLAAYRTSDVELFERRVGGALAAHERKLPLGSEDAVGYLQRGLARLAMLDGKGATADLERVLLYDPNHREARLGLADARSVLGNTKGAVECYDLLLRSGDDPDLLVHRAACLLKLVQLDRARADCERALEIDPDFAPGHDTLGMVLLARGKARAALQHGERAVRLAPRKARFWVNLSSIRYRLSDWEGMAQACQRALALDDKLPSAYANRGVARRNQGKPMEAIADFGRMIELDPSNPNGWVNRAGVRVVLEDLQGAREDLQRAAELDPQASMVWFQRGVLRSAEGEPRAAINEISRAIELEPGRPRYWKSRGDLRLELEDWRGAVQDLSKGLELAPDGPTYNNRSRAFLGLGDVRRALADMERAVRLSPRNPDYHSNRGRLLQAMGRTKDAEEAFTKALELDPFDVSARGARAACRNNNGNQDGALEDYADILERHPAQPRALLGRAIVHLQRKEDPARILQDLNLSLKGEPGNPMALYLRGQVHTRLGRRADARSDLEEALRRGLHPALRGECEELLSKLR